MSVEFHPVLQIVSLFIVKNMKINFKQRTKTDSRIEFHSHANLLLNVQGYRRDRIFRFDLKKPNNIIVLTNNISIVIILTDIIFISIINIRNCYHYSHNLNRNSFQVHLDLVTLKKKPWLWIISLQWRVSYAFLSEIFTLKMTLTFRRTLILFLGYTMIIEVILFVIWMNPVHRFRRWRCKFKLINSIIS